LKMVGAHTSGAKRQKKIGRAPPLFGYARRTIYALVVIGERFRGGQYTYGQFLVCCSSTHGNPCSAICKSGGIVSPCLIGRRHCSPGAREPRLRSGYLDTTCK